MGWWVACWYIERLVSDVLVQRPRNHDVGKDKPAAKRLPQDPMDVLGRKKECSLRIVAELQVE